MVKDWRHLKAMTLAHALNDDCHSLSPIDRLGLGIQALWLVLDHPDELLLPTLPINFWWPSSIHYRQLKPWINVQSTAKCTPSSPSIHHHLSTSIFTIAKAQRLTLPPLLHKDLLNRVCSASQPKARWWDDHISWSGFTLMPCTPLGHLALSMALSHPRSELACGRKDQGFQLPLIVQRPVQKHVFTNRVNRMNYITELLCGMLQESHDSMRKRNPIPSRDA